MGVGKQGGSIFTPISTITPTLAWDSFQPLVTPAPLWNVTTTSRKSCLKSRLHLSGCQCTGERATGRRLLLNHSLHSSLDNDECADEEPACEGGRCVNTIGSYHCTCEPPLVLDGSRRRCVSNESQSLGKVFPRPAPSIITPQSRPRRPAPLKLRSASGLHPGHAPRTWLGHAP